MNELGKRGGLFYLLIPVVSFLAYFYTFKVGFIWDDYLYIQQQLASIRDFNFYEGLRKFTYFRPTVTIFSLLDYSIWHRNPLGYHITNFIFQTANALLTALLVNRLLLSLYSRSSMKTASLPDPDSLRWAPILAGLLFAVHPIHTESVNWVEGRTDLICTTFFLLSFISYVEFRTKKSLGALFACLVFAVFAMAAKEPAVTLPVVIFAYEFVFSENRRAVLFAAIAALLLSAVIVFARRHILYEILIPHLEAGSLKEFLRLSVLSYGFYLKKIFVPYPLNFFIGDLPENLPFFVFSIVSLAGLIVMPFILRQKAPFTSFMILWWLVTILPHLLVLPGGTSVNPVAERYIYLPSVAFCGVVALMLTCLKPRALRWGISSAVLVIFLAMTIHRTWVWTDEERLWKDTVEKSPEFGLPYQWYGNALQAKGKSQEAIEVWKKGLECPYQTGRRILSNPVDDQFRKCLLHTSIAGTYLANNRDEDAKKHCIIAMQFFPHYNTIFFLGIIEHRAAEKAEDPLVRRIHLKFAYDFFSTAVKMNPSHQEGIYSLALAEKDLGMDLEAMDHFKMALELDPRTPVAVQAAIQLERLRARAYTPVVKPKDNSVRQNQSR